MRKSERGSIVALFGLAMAVTAGVMLLLSYVAAALLHASWAQTAADAAALAGAGNGETAARNAAAANHSELVSIRTVGTDTLVTTKSGNQIKTARARKTGPVYALRNAG